MWRQASPCTKAKSIACMKQAFDAVQHHKAACMIVSFLQGRHGAASTLQTPDCSFKRFKAQLPTGPYSAEMLSECARAEALRHACFRSCTFGDKLPGTIYQCSCAKPL